MSSFDDEADQISDAEKLQIAQHYLLASPPGQFQEVLNETGKLVPSSVLTEGVVAGTARAFNNKTLRVVQTPAGHKAVISAASEVDATHYKDNNNAVFGINHVTLATTEDSSIESEGDGQLELYRSAVQQAVTTYIGSKFLTEQSAGTVSVKEGKLHVSICSEKPNLRNYWSGKWTSSWHVTVSGGSSSIVGEVKIHAHYFEDGNVQMVSNKAIPAATINGNSEAELAAAVVKHIKNSESTLQAALEDMYANMSEETFKSMRRTIPITRTKMDWNLNSVRMIRQVRK